MDDEIIESTRLVLSLVPDRIVLYSQDSWQDVINRSGYRLIRAGLSNYKNIQVFM